MDKFNDYISLVLKGIYASSKCKKDIADELRDHLEMVKKELIDAGFSETEAEAMAIERFGQTKDIVNKFNKLFTPFRRVKDTLKEKRVLTESLQWVLTIAGALILSLTIRSYAFATTEVKQCSMQSTLFEGQRLIENKIEYYYSHPKRGDIVIIDQKAEKGVLKTFVLNTKEFIDGFYKKETDQKLRLIKRVIGVPGDEIDIREGKVYINGDSYNEPYVKGITFPNNTYFPIIVPDKKYFVMGDNRENSMDSRDIGLIGSDQIEGKAVLRVWPIEMFGDIY